MICKRCEEDFTAVYGHGWTSREGLVDWFDRHHGGPRHSKISYDPVHNRMVIVEPCDGEVRVSKS